MFAIIAAVCFLVAFIFSVAGISLGTLGAFAFVCLGLLFMALSHGAFGSFFNRGAP
jgi:hypothetical protein